MTRLLPALALFGTITEHLGKPIPGTEPTRLTSQLELLTAQYSGHLGDVHIAALTSGARLRVCPDLPVVARRLTPDLTINDRAHLGCESRTAIAGLQRSLPRLDTLIGCDADLGQYRRTGPYRRPAGRTTSSLITLYRRFRLRLAVAVAR